MHSKHLQEEKDLEGEITTVFCTIGFWGFFFAIYFLTLEPIM